MYAILVNIPVNQFCKNGKVTFDISVFANILK